MAHFGDLLHRLTESVATRDPGQPLSARMCAAYRDLAGAGAAALTVDYARANRVTLCTTSEVARRLEDLQDVLGEGPGHSAARSGQIEVCAVPGSSSSRWSIFVEASQDVVDAATIHAVPMHPEREVLGVITLYDDRSDHRRLTLGRDQLQFLANVVGAALIGEAGDTASFNSGPWASRAQVHQATGMVVAQLHISPDDALAVLRAHAYGQQATLSEIAAAVVERRLTFTPH
ncbi:ANTAR domain-containing protein [Nocardioides carbamazepini]|uniref:ANTAR domain-containing protein n=1 Tax=Nocardioides carbamazepini TaxID=2854259 RepID=UPI00214A7A99|nr:ANTAR domain-containing protein [Nocardioides carbamazepini]MCR1785269.1 ANTAR domain-containing protein [Nocardioides carbamazepini]